MALPFSSRTAQWKKIDALLQKEQSATAAPLVEAIYQEARQQRDTPDYVRALLYRLGLLGSQTPSAEEQGIALLESDLATADFPARPILHSLLGELYTTYLRRYRYRIYQRTTGAAPTTNTEGSSLATWDLSQLGAVIVAHYRQSVEDEPTRQLQTPLAELGALATAGDEEGQALRPSLYDLLAHRAIAGLRNQELYLTKPEQQFEFTDPRLFNSAAEFAALPLLAPPDDQLNGQLHALQLLQQLTAQRLAATPPQPAALADVDLQRLDYLRDITADTALADEYGAALARLADTYQALPASAEFRARRATWLREAGDATAAVAAVAEARTAEAQFPQSRGAQQARQLRLEIEQPELHLTAADTVLPGQPWRLDLSLRNVTELHAWAYPLTPGEWRKMNKLYGEERLEFQARVVRQPAAANWALPLLPAPLDYQKRSVAVAGAALPVGYYLLLVSNQAAQPLEARAGLVTSYGHLAVSELSAVTRSSFAEPASRELLVLHRQSGAPLAGVQVQAYFKWYDYEASQYRRRQSEVLTTPATGEVLLPPTGPAERITRVHLWQGTDTLQLNDLGYSYPPRRPGPEEAQRNVLLFTDRAIYRPGQTLYFKGVLTESLAGEARVLPGQPVSVRLLDVNGQAALSLTFTTSSFGSFHGSLVLPTGLLNGQMTLQTDHGSVGFAVEDYKRPTFEVTLEPVAGQPRLGEALTLSGRARAYAGHPTDGASVSYRVTRRELWGGWSPWGRGSSGSQQIAHGTTTTDAEGRFAISFTPPLGPAGSAPRGYRFDIVADVTEAAGETRTATQYLAIGANPLSLSLSGPDLMDKQQLGEFSLLGANATGEPLPATGTVRVLARHYRPNPPGVPGPAPETATNEAEPEQVQTLAFDTQAQPSLDLAATLAALPTGRYQLVAVADGPDPAQVTHNFTLYDSAAATVPFATPDWALVLTRQVAPGEPATLLLGSSEAGANILLEVERGGEVLRREWLTLAAGEQRQLVLASGPVPGRGALHVHTTQVRDNHLYRHDTTVAVVAPPQPLTLSLSTFRDRLQPGQRETWRLTIRQADGRPSEAELLATLYDQSLDLFRSHGFGEFYLGGSYYPALLEWRGEFGELSSEELFSLDYPEVLTVRYPTLTTWLGLFSRAIGGYGIGGGGDMRKRSRNFSVGEVQDEGANMDFMAAEAPGSALPAPRSAPAPAPAMERERGMAPPEPPAPPAAEAAPDLGAVPIRSDFRETALWEPALRTDENGDVVLEFQMPEAVTRWQLLALAHDSRLRSGRLVRQLVTQKEIQISPNAPRFFRQGDSCTFAAKLSNLTDQPTHGTAQLFLLDAATGQDITSQLLRNPAQQAVAAAAHGSVALGWDISLPADFAPVAVTYRVVAQAVASPVADNPEPATYSDGEENTLPVLPNRLLLTESLPLPVVGPGTRTFELTKLTSTTSPTRRNYSLTLEMTANPAWYAVQSLPYLQEYPYECSEQVFSRLYANLLAAHLLQSNPRFKTVLAEWTRQAQNGIAAQQNALESKLAQNQDLKNLLLQETPWVRDAQDETEQLTRLSTLFDETRLAAETRRALLKLQKQQLPGGAFPWFEHMPADRYISQLLVAGFGKLQRLGAFDALQHETAGPLLTQALRYLDQALAGDYADLLKTEGVQLTDDHLGDLHVQALYARSFWPQPVAGDAQAAYAYYRSQATRYWPGRTRYLQAQMALSLHRADVSSRAAQEIMRALTENALHSPELGMYWPDVRAGYYWREAPTETQATLIEAFDEVSGDQPAVNEMKLWLLKQKQTQHWESTRATVDACYALLLRGADWLAPAQLLAVTVGGAPVVPAAAQAGTGYFKTSWPAAEVQPAQGHVTVTKADAGVAWGALYWQYFEDLDKVTPAATPLSLERELYREVPTAAGPRLEPLTPAAPLRVGEALVVRLVLRTDRRLEYVHLKDQRAAGLEPIGQTSGYRYQNGLGYYESPRDAATNFFFGSVPAGTHVFEYRLRASQVGDFSGGLSQVQCLYAPEFAAHSAGSRVQIG